MKAKLFLALLLVISLIGFVSAEGNSTCIDSDGGMNYYVKGDSTFIHPSTGSLFNESDFCMSNTTLAEQYCKSDYEIDNVVFNCPNGCQDGACIR